MVLLRHGRSSQQTVSGRAQPASPEAEMLCVLILPSSAMTRSAHAASSFPAAMRIHSSQRPPACFSRHVPEGIASCATAFKNCEGVVEIGKLAKLLIPHRLWTAGNHKHPANTASVIQRTGHCDGRSVFPVPISISNAARNRWMNAALGIRPELVTDNERSDLMRVGRCINGQGAMAHCQPSSAYHPSGNSVMIRIPRVPER